MICIECVPLPHKHILGSIIEIDEGHQVNLKTKQQLSTKTWPSYSKNKIAMRKTSITKQKNKKNQDLTLKAKLTRGSTIECTKEIYTNEYDKNFIINCAAAH